MELIPDEIFASMESGRTASPAQAEIAAAPINAATGAATPRRATS
jgi:hypothetical protein